ncbi:hypothetical protein EWK04_08960 [Salmonella enterica subsp. enterica serovar Java]|uniref:Uncharacterized protein n=2 Tax=Salmonella enterica TaxID=28901 RepID=A0A5T8B552_SALER|nr:hypothetical protein [Salmonella enterica subsp. enterica serovar Java]EBM2192474.1 hypothetical protein [Salmonella enterica]EDD5837950.1 hypothetical protein [Salmonella enterica subsp. enterica serovar Enteritidis]HCM8924234.1 hypothetical protein [Salmonella enterica subsp. enterica serovar Paratyphi B]EBN4399629.1 hypothetical protein [Salmonella enterica]
MKETDDSLLNAVSVAMMINILFPVIVFIVLEFFDYKNTANNIIAACTLGLLISAISTIFLAFTRFLKGEESKD